MTIELTGGWSQIRVPLVQSSGNFTAALNRDYTITATATVTDPTPAEGRLFTSFVVNGTATIGGTAYSTAGAMVRRRYHSGAWANYVYPHLDGAWSWSATQSFANGTAALPSIAFSTDLDTGFYKPASNTVGISCNGVAAAQCASASGQGTFTTFSISDTATTSPEYVFSRARVTGTNGQTLSGDRIGAFRFRGTDDTGSSATSGTFYTVAAENFTSTGRGSYLEVNLVPIGSTAGTARMRFHNDGGYQVGTLSGTSPGLGVTTTSTAIVAGTTTRIGSESGRFAGGTIATPTSTDVVTGGGAIAAGAGITSISQTAGIGYGAGAGGTVTQITSRTTGVTLNRVTGAITLVSAAGSAAWQSFTVTNSAVAATDTIKVCQVSGTDLNMIHVTAVAAGSFRITFATTGGTTVEQPVFRFTLIKSVSA